jgi:hypothetical protein
MLDPLEAVIRRDEALPVNLWSTSAPRWRGLGDPRQGDTTMGSDGPGRVRVERDFECTLTLERVAELARDWFLRHLGGR